MTIFKSIQQARTIIQEISKNIQNNDNIVLLESLSKELDNITGFAKHLTTKESPSESKSFKPEIKSGCYIFSDEKGFFCPHCYDNTGRKVATKRLNSKLRVCPACRASIT